MAAVSKSGPSDESAVLCGGGGGGARGGFGKFDAVKSGAELTGPAAFSGAELTEPAAFAGALGGVTGIVTLG